MPIPIAARAGAGEAGADAPPLAPAAAAPRTRHDPFPDVWLDTVRVRLSGDRDGDGYHSRLGLSIDVDTDVGFAEVYASVALVERSGRLGLAYDTDAFAPSGATSRDRLDVEFELLDDFPSDAYGLYVEVRDARTGRALDGVGPDEFASLSHLRLEGTRRDGHGHGYEIGYGIGFSSGYSNGLHGGYGGVRDDGDGSTYTGVSYAGTGALDPLALGALAMVAGAALARRRRR